MSAVTGILQAIERGDPAAAEQLLPLVYGELRKLAAQKMTEEQPGQTLQATALVHEAYLRLVNADDPQLWNSRGHFFAAAAEAMRRILVEKARRRKTLRRGGHMQRIGIDFEVPAEQVRNDEVLALDAALDRLAQMDATKAELVKLRYFAGMTIPEAAAALNISLTTANRYWAYARVWLHDAIRRSLEADS